MEVFENSGNKESEINLEDFPFICRICLGRGALRLFEKEDYLLDLFVTITKIDKDGSTLNFPRNICNECVNKLEDISLFIDISKSNGTRQEKNWNPKTENGYKVKGDCGIIQEHKIKTEKPTKGYGDDVYSDGSEICQICFLTSCEKLVEENAHLMQVFQKITNVDVKAESNFQRRHRICTKCTDKLKKISSFIGLSLRNNMRLINTIVRNVTVKTEKCFEVNGTDVASSKCNDMKYESISYRNEVKKEIPVSFSKMMSQKTREKNGKRPLEFVDGIASKQARKEEEKSLAKVIITNNSEDEFEPREVFKSAKKSPSKKMSGSKLKVVNYSNTNAERWPSDKKMASSTAAAPIVKVAPIVAPIEVVSTVVPVPYVEAVSTATPTVAPIEFICTSVKAIPPPPEAVPLKPEDPGLGPLVRVTRHFKEPDDLGELGRVVRKMKVTLAEKKRRVEASDSAILAIHVESTGLQNRLFSLAKLHVQEINLRAKRQAELDTAKTEMTKFRDEVLKLFEI